MNVLHGTDCVIFEFLHKTITSGLVNIHGITNLINRKRQIALAASANNLFLNVEAKERCNKRQRLNCYQVIFSPLSHLVVRKSNLYLQPLEPPGNICSMQM